MLEAKCKKCRRAGEKLYLKGDKCYTAKCPFIERPYAPGILDSQRKHRGQMSEYGIQLKEKQKVRNVYGVSEKQFANYVKNINAVAIKNKITPQEGLIASLESRLDNVVYRMGFASSRALARQLVSHGHFTVNGRKLDVPSYLVTLNDVVAVREGSKGAKVFTALSEKENKTKTPNWLDLSMKDMSAKVIGLPLDTDQKFDLSRVLEYYSR